MAKLYGRWGAYDARSPEEKARARRQQAKRAADNAAAQSWKEKHRWCVNGCGKEAAWYPGGMTLLHDGACSAECLAAYEAGKVTPNAEITGG